MSTHLSERAALATKARQIGEMVKGSLEMSIFKHAERELQGDAVAQELLGRLQMIEEDAELETVLERLENLDVVRRFTIAQENLSEVVAHVTKILAATVSDRLDLVTKQKGSCASCPSTGCAGTGTSESCDSGAAACSEH